ncbi:heat shock protein HspQ [Candidatus Tachikawaea gelatinosa]|uniref:Heat shock protein HspQ n=1 Tax=Candidatus Tachikawaea gelatinosa TaxID=1410383 RepID=A0A090ARF1_9ENTR|nr:heat shock protein HspQ [Candidatus Tachikawaea gelatinosa]BAP58345.1 heat shock protein HspQ [Candidatus Tachikawaea gelatinosa]
MIASKFNIGQQVRHKNLGILGVIIDIDIKCSISHLTIQNIKEKEKKNFNYPWYHLIVQDEDGDPMHIYISEKQLATENFIGNSKQSSIDKLSTFILLKLQKKNHH